MKKELIEKHGFNETEADAIIEAYSKLKVIVPNADILDLIKPINRLSTLQETLHMKLSTNQLNKKKNIKTNTNQ